MNQQKSQLYDVEKIRLGMSAINISAEELALITNMTPTTLRKIRNGQDAKVSNLIRVAEALRIEVSELFEKRTAQP